MSNASNLLQWKAFDVSSRRWWFLVMRNTRMTPITLSPDDLNAVLTRIAPTGKEYGAARIARFLAEEHSVLTVRINTRCAVGNISDLVSTAINPRISDLGLYVACVKPPRQVSNRFGQPSGMMEWSFYRDTAANDPAYQQESLQEALRRDLRALQADYPQDYQQGISDPESRQGAAHVGGN